MRSGGRRLNSKRASVLIGIGFVVLACACFAVLDTTAKYLTASVPILLAVWARYLFQAIVSAAVLVPTHGLAILRIRHPLLQTLRGLMLVSSTTIAFLSLAVMPLAEFTAILMVTPLVVTVIAVLVLKERISAMHWLCVGGGFIGVLVILRPGYHDFGWASLLPLGCVATNSLFQLLSSHLGKLEKPATTHLFSTWVGAGMSTLVLPFVWTRVDSLWLWALMFLCGAMGAIGHFVLTLAYERAGAVTLVPFLYFHIGFAVIGGWLVFSQLPDSWTWAGIALIAVSGIVGAWLSARENSVVAKLPET